MQITEGKGKLVLLGPDSEVKQMIRAAMERSPEAGTVLCAQSGVGTVLCAQSDAEAEQEKENAATRLAQEDCVLLFGRYGTDAQAEDVQWVQELTEAIAQIQKVRPRAALFLSDTMVYGKLFGEQRLLKEDEIGYVCHTSKDDTAAQWMRTAEHLCARLAREEGLSIKIARADWEHIPVMLQAGEGSATILAVILELLKNGTAGEAYNISGLTSDVLVKKSEECAKTRSPLAPMELFPDIGKAENYAAS